MLRFLSEIASAWLLSIALLTVPSVSHGQTIGRKAGKVHTPQVELGYETLGNRNAATPLVVINGGPGLSHAYLMYTNVWQYIAQKRMVIFYDQRGTGTSTELQPNTPQNLDAQLSDIEALRKSLGLDKFILLGDSFGGLFAMAYASAYPEHIDKMVLSDSPGSTLKDWVHLFNEVFPDAMARQQAQSQAVTDPKEAAQQALLEHFKLLFYASEQRDLYFKKLGNVTHLGYNPDIAGAVFNDFSKVDFTPKLASFHFPTLVINGRFDMNIAPLTAWRLKQAIPGAQLVYFEKSGHFPWFEEPEKYGHVLSQFFDTVK